MSTIYITLVTGLLMLLPVTTSIQQNDVAKTIIRNDNNCESNKAYFDYVATHAGDTGSLILIARLGDGERSRLYNQRRLHNIGTYFNYIREIPKSRIVKAEGERATGRGRVEVYVRGELMIVFEMGRNQDLAGGECEMPRSELYYPMERKRR